MQRQSVLVVGCGVIGLSSALELQRAGWRVSIAARSLPPNTVSNIAAALWYPYAVSPRERCDAWAMQSLQVFSGQAREPSSGVRMRHGVEFCAPDGEASELMRCLPGARAARADELRRGYSSGVVFEAPVIETSIYLPWLMREFERRGGVIEVLTFGTLDEALERAPIVVNCSGFGARELAPDASMYAIRGQILRVEHSALQEFSLEHQRGGGTTYVVPRSSDCVLGGTREEHREDLWADARQSEDILRRCSALAPSVGNLRVLETLVGLRPGRPVVRLELERRPGGCVVHNYGHGGAGVTLSWGCAREVLELLNAAKQ